MFIRINRFLDKAAIITPQDSINPDGSAYDPWNLCSIQQAEEVKCVIRLLPIWFSSMFYCVALVQPNTMFVFQALQSDRTFFNTNFKIPAASYTIFTMLILTISLPIYDRIVVPTIQKFTRKESWNHAFTKNGNWNVYFHIVHVSIWIGRSATKDYGY
jgi:peptide/histidine transporter 3/4